MARKSTYRKLSRRAKNDQLDKWAIVDNYSRFAGMPDDLIVIVLQHLRKMSRYLLKRALFVCRKWHDIGMPMLWTAVRFEKLCEIGTLAVCLGQHRRPQLASGIRSLTFHMSEEPLSPSWRERQEGLPIKQAVSVIERLGQLGSSSIRAPYAHVHVVSSLVQSLRPSVTSLEVHLDSSKGRSRAACESSRKSHICSAMRSKLKHLTCVNFRGILFCRQLVPENKDAMGSGEMTICLIDSRYRQSAEHLVFNLASLFAVHYRTPQAVDTVKRVTIINFQAHHPTSGDIDQMYFDFVHIRDVAKGEQTIVPARILNTHEKSATKHLFLWMTSNTKTETLHDYYATSWNQVVLLADPTAWLEEPELGIRLPKTLIASPAYKYKHYRWRALAATPKEAEWRSGPLG